MMVINRPLPYGARRMRFPVNPRVLLSVVVVAVVVFLIGSRNPVTPAGHVGYLTRGAVFGREQFAGLQTGPTSAGRGWLLRVVNVPVTPVSYDEAFTGADSVLASDGLKLTFHMHLVLRVRPDRVRQLLQEYSTPDAKAHPGSLGPSAYRNVLREPLRGIAREEISRHAGLEVKNDLGDIGRTLTARARELTRDTPFDVSSVTVGDVEYPPELVKAVSLKLAAAADLARKTTELEIARREKERRVLEAQGIAEAAQIIAQRLTPSYLQYEAIKVQKEALNSPGRTTVYIPVGAMGVPASVPSAAVAH